MAQKLAGPDAAWLLRNEPIQARSLARLDGLLDAAATIVDELGFERLTTAMVAERAGASIGTVYRYFPDRIVLLQALASRNLSRVNTRVTDEVVDPKHGDWLAALSAAMGILVEAYRLEPGFRGLRVGDMLDLRPPVRDRTERSVIADALLDGLVARFGLPDSPEIRFTFETAMEVSEALATRAFTFDAEGDVRFLIAGRDLVYDMLVPHFGEVVVVP